MDPLVVGRVIGDVLDPFTSSVSLEVIYNNNQQVLNSSDFKPSQIQNKPTVHIAPHHDHLTTLYTLIMVNPDAPSPSDPYMREYLHWLITNIPATRGAAVDLSLLGEEIVKYESPMPRSGIHRIVFVVFRQMDGRQRIHAPTWRHNFNTRDFAQVYNLGLPVAALYFNSQRESGWGGRRFFIT